MEKDKVENLSEKRAKLFKDNYEGASEYAKEIEPYLKETYKGDVYLPWATMERLTYAMDPDAQFNNVVNADGSLVHTNCQILRQKNVQKGEIVSETEATMLSHTVRVSLTWLGKTIIEDYPIQDKDYGAAKVYDQNLVNRALQRAKAKVAARATGLGLKLYEGKDLQFDEKKEVITKETVKEVKERQTNKKETVKEVKEEAVKDEKPVDLTNLPEAITAIIAMIKQGEEANVNSVLQKVNVSLMKKYFWGLSRVDGDDKLAKKLSELPDVDKFRKSLVKLGLEEIDG